ncbi:MAG: putative selenate reductase subunit YgfK [Candidatus Neomarinimicrobiota bacterium]
MSDKLYPLPLNKLLAWILREEQHGKIFGYHKELFFNPKAEDKFRMERYGQILETPIGVAAGPHTQLAHNIVLAWLFGARYLELKTVQTLDEIEVAKPCIDMTDEGYNCEWSQELKLRQSFDEYLNAWIIIHILKDKFSWGEPETPGFIFNMSVGYDLKGILNTNVQDYFALMHNCDSELNQKLYEISDIYPNVKNIVISSQITDNITLSTMHGCPSHEIEKIGKYLIEERKLNTAIKLNPTLLESVTLRQILNKDLNFHDIIVPDEAFEHDLKYDDALVLIKNLQNSAKQNKVKFGLKLTNTLEVLNTLQTLPKQEITNYLSGRALHPISVNLAAKLQVDFDGKLDISFSAGADAFNITNILACNIKPITTCTDVLKPGGYGRLKQYLVNIRTELHSFGAQNIDEYIINLGGKADVEQSGLLNLNKYSKEVIQNPTYQNNFTGFESIKTNHKLTQFDCINAPCIGPCATDQQIPEYIYHTAQGDFNKSFEVIMQTNPLPGITGAVCDQLCSLKCTRSNYDNSLLIRDIKRFSTEFGSENYSINKINQNNIRIAIIGGGSAGLSCAYFLVLAGCNVEIFETKRFSGGMVSSAIPRFRLSEEAFQNDVERIMNLGVQIHYNSKIDSPKFNLMQNEFDYVYIATGAQKNKKLNIVGEDLENVIEPIEFLANVKKELTAKLGISVAIIGGGNTAMDAARTAMRLVGDTGKVTILYRRTRKEMPAEDAEIQAALNEGVKLIELVSPIAINGNGKVKSITCEKMTLGKPDASGRSRPVPIPNSEFTIICDSIIPSVGQNIELDFLGEQKLKVNQKTGATNIANVFAGGDAVRGAATVVEAVGDGKTAAQNILKIAKMDGIILANSNKVISEIELQQKAIRREFGISVPKYQSNNQLDFNLIHRTMSKDEVITEASRCLYCDEVCSICVYVCPNLANMAFKTKPLETVIQNIIQKGEKITISDINTNSFEQETQIINFRDFCNDCGNCTTFCPTSGDPSKIKPHFYLTEKSFSSESEGYYLNNEYLQYKKADFIEIMKIEEDHLLYSNNFLSAIINKENMRINALHSKVDYDYEWSSDSAVKMGYLSVNLEKEAIFKNNE